MSYTYGKPYKQRDGWHYWGHHTGVVPEIVGPFETEDEARKHADKHGYGRQPRRDLPKFERRR